MYLVKSPGNNDLEDYYQTYSPIVKQKLIDTLSGAIVFPPYSLQNNRTYTCVVQPGSQVANLLTKYTVEEDLRRLLIGDFLTLLDIVAEFSSVEPKFMSKLSATKHGKVLPNSTKNVEDINYIFSEIFVKGIYEYDACFNKAEFAIKKNIEVCPYCGIIATKHYNVKKGKEEYYAIEHYLPKSKFPFLALSYFNMVVACEHCNKIGNCKGDKSPLAADNRTQLLMHPYSFRDEALNFNLKYNGRGIFARENFEISIDYHGNQNIKEGYTEVIPIEQKYKGLDGDALKIWTRMSSINQNLATKGIGNLSPLTVLGYDITAENSRTQEKFKFETEIYNQLLDLLNA